MAGGGSGTLQCRQLWLSLLMSRVPLPGHAMPFVVQLQLLHATHCKMCVAIHLCISLPWVESARQYLPFVKGLHVVSRCSLQIAANAVLACHLITPHGSLRAATALVTWDLPSHAQPFCTWCVLHCCCHLAGPSECLMCQCYQCLHMHVWCGDSRSVHVYYTCVCADHASICC